MADLLGLNASTATRWAQLAGGNWTPYATDLAAAAAVHLFESPR